MKNGLPEAGGLADLPRIGWAAVFVAEVAAVRKLLALVCYGLPDGHVPALERAGPS